MNRYPTLAEEYAYIDGYEDGHYNGYIEAVEKAVEWLENHNDYIDVKDGNVTYFDMEKCVEDFRKAMEGGKE